MYRIKLLFFCVGLLFIISSSAQQVKLGKDHCRHCSMLINDEQFAAVLQGEESEVLTFDAIECLINFLKSNDESSYQNILVANYSRKGKWIDAKTAIYLKSNSIPSPMGAYLSAYEDQKTAGKVQAEMHGTLYTWTEIKAQFEDSGFGLLDHPDHHLGKPDAFAPIGVMGDHVHHKGSAMISLRYSFMGMEGNRERLSNIGNEQIYESYMIAPQEMKMHMYTLGAMYAFTDKLTLMLMQSFIVKEMELRSMSGMDFETESQGLGDTKVSILYSLFGHENVSFHINSGVSVPSGQISKSDDTPMSDDLRLPYPMQLGSGTFDFTLGATFRQSINQVSWAFQQLNTFRTRKNDQGYRKGNAFFITSWIAYNLNQWLGISGRVEGVIQTAISGKDNNLNPMMAPPADYHNSGHEKLRSYFGANFSLGSHPVLQKIKIGLEYGFPIYQHVSGIQMKETETIKTGIRFIL